MKSTQGHLKKEMNDFSSHCTEPDGMTGRLKTRKDRVLQNCVNLLMYAYLNHVNERITDYLQTKFTDFIIDEELNGDKRLKTHIIFLYSYE